MDPLSEADLERLIDGFEKAKNVALLRSRAAWNLEGSSSDAKPPEERPPAEIYPVAQALEVSFAFLAHTVVSAT